MNTGKALATLLIAIDILAGVGYAFNAEPKRCVYFIAAAVLTYCVTY